MGDGGQHADCPASTTTRGTTEVTDLEDAQQLERFAQKKGFSTISTWAAQRDNGGCPGTLGSDYCSGIAQPDWAFASILNPFTGS